MKICLETGSEFLAGSTRLAAGTSQKIALNLFSTSLMIKLNRVYKGFMIDVVASNEKLKKDHNIFIRNYWMFRRNSH